MGKKLQLLKGSSDDKLFQSHCHSLIGRSTVKCSKLEACIYGVKRMSTNCLEFLAIDYICSMVVGLL
jgi:hypothetical protein